MRKEYRTEVENFVLTISKSIFNDLLDGKNTIYMSNGAFILREHVFMTAMDYAINGSTIAEKLTGVDFQKQLAFSLLFVLAYKHKKSDLILMSFSTANEALSLNEYRYRLQKSYDYHLDVLGYGIE